MMLTPLELDVMKAVWRRPPITVRDVQEAIRPSRKLAYTTVMTIMDRLYHKGFLTRKLRARTHFYEPAIRYTDVRDDAVKRLVEDFFDGSPERLQEFLNGEDQDLPSNGGAEPATGTPLDETLL
ncbi:MAG TPA: BlaI/MecI/CopY family transcriptional regulator [Terriglobia bacterium]|nr:BlaI/MecI/CopY family transcriptional regulator [Terriglobia bacterium]